jgi:uncharacterized protein YecE (DUF72 family)
MPFLFPKEIEFVLASIDGKPVDQAVAGRFKIIDEGNETYKMMVKPCDEKEWKDPRPEDVEFLVKTMKRYEAK